MIADILNVARHTQYDFRLTACPDDPLKHLFDEWVPRYRFKWAVARTLQPQRILGIGDYFGYCAAALLDACPASEYVGIDDDPDRCSGCTTATEWARHITQGANATYISVADYLAQFPSRFYDLVHIDARRGEAASRDFRKAFQHAGYILVDGYFGTREAFLDISELFYRYRDAIETILVIPGYEGEVLIKPRPVPNTPELVSDSSQLKATYTDAYYLTDCGGFDAYKRDKGLSLRDGRLRCVAELAGIAPLGRALDLGCGRGELSIYLSKMGHDVLGVDYSASAISLARAAAAENAPDTSRIGFHCGDVNGAPFSGPYQAVVASDLVEHLTPAELDRLYDRIATHLAPDGIFVVHTFPNAWYYKYEHARRWRAARKLGAYLPLEPRSRYAELMHINEQSPRVLRRQLRAHFENVLLWFCGHDLVNPFENLRRVFSRSEMRAAGDLFALATHVPIHAQSLYARLAMHATTEPLSLALATREAPSMVQSGSRFRIRVRLTNASGIDLKSRAPHPVHLSYHCYAEDGEMCVFDGLRTTIPLTKAGSTVDTNMELQAPAHEGAYLFRLTLVQEQVRWFDKAPQELFDDQWIQVVRPGRAG